MPGIDETNCIDEDGVPDQRKQLRLVARRNLFVAHDEKHAVLPRFEGIFQFVAKLTPGQVRLIQKNRGALTARRRLEAQDNHSSEIVRHAALEIVGVEKLSPMRFRFGLQRLDFVSSHEPDGEDREGNEGSREKNGSPRAHAIFYRGLRTENAADAF